MGLEVSDEAIRVLEVVLRGALHPSSQNSCGEEQCEVNHARGVQYRHHEGHIHCTAGSVERLSRLNHKVVDGRGVAGLDVAAELLDELLDVAGHVHVDRKIESIADDMEANIIELVPSVMDSFPSRTELLGDPGHSCLRGGEDEEIVDVDADENRLAIDDADEQAWVRDRLMKSQGKKIYGHCIVEALGRFVSAINIFLQPEEERSFGGNHGDESRVVLANEASELGSDVSVERLRVRCHI